MVMSIYKAVCTCKVSLMDAAFNVFVCQKTSSLSAARLMHKLLVIECLHSKAEVCSD